MDNSKQLQLFNVHCNGGGRAINLDGYPGIHRNPDRLRQPDSHAVEFSNTMLESIMKIPTAKVVETLDISSERIGCKNENGALRRAAVSLPTFLDWGEGINECEKRNMLNKPDRYLAVLEHIKFMGLLLEAGVELVVIKPGLGRLEGVYARDLATVIGDKCILSNFAFDTRKREEETIIGGIKPPKEVIMEGGNLVVENGMVFLGIGARTNYAAAVWLQEVLGTSFMVIPIFLKDEVLHLDCMFSPVSGNGRSGAIVYPKGFAHAHDLEIIEKIYRRVLAVTDYEYENLGANTLALNEKVRIVNSQTPRVQQYLEDELRQSVLPVNLGEIVRGGGYARCAALALKRG